MRRCILLVLLGLSHIALSQDKRFSLSTNVLNLAAEGPSLSLSYQYSPKLAFQVYVSSGNFDRYLSSGEYQFKTAVLDTKFFVGQQFYAGPYFRYIDKRVKREGFVDHTGFIGQSERDFHGHGMSAGVLLGWKVYGSRALDIETFAGTGYGKFLWQKDYSGQNKKTGFIDGRVGLLVGLKL